MKIRNSLIPAVRATKQADTTESIREGACSRLLAQVRTQFRAAATNLRPKASIGGLFLRL